MLSPLLNFKTGVTEFDWPFPICLKSYSSRPSIYLSIISNARYRVSSRSLYLSKLTSQGWYHVVVFVCRGLEWNINVLSCDYENSRHYSKVRCIRFMGLLCILEILMVSFPLAFFTPWFTYCHKRVSLSSSGSSTLRSWMERPSGVVQGWQHNNGTCPQQYLQSRSAPDTSNPHSYFRSLSFWVLVFSI